MNGDSFSATPDEEIRPTRPSDDVYRCEPTFSSVQVFTDAEAQSPLKALEREAEEISQEDEPGYHKDVRAEQCARRASETSQASGQETRAQCPLQSSTPDFLALRDRVAALNATMDAIEAATESLPVATHTELESRGVLNMVRAKAGEDSCSTGRRFTEPGGVDVTPGALEEADLETEIAAARNQLDGIRAGQNILGVHMQRSG